MWHHWMCHWLSLSIVTSSLEPEKEETSLVGLQNKKRNIKKLTIGPNNNSHHLGHVVAIVVAYLPSSLPVSTLQAVAHGGGWGCYCGGGLDCVISKCCESISKVI
jgi:hypothetical protein